MKVRYILIILSAISIGVSLVIRIPKVVDEATDKAVEKHKPFVHAYNTCDVILQGNRYKEAADCFSKMLKEYDRGDVRYNYAFALASLKDYGHAKQELEYIIDNEKQIPEIVETAKKLNKQIDDILATMRIESKDYVDVQNKNLDVGDYFSDLKEYTRWENPKNITVYIEDDPQKELYKEAFTQWNGALGGAVYFKFIDSKDANIVCSFVEKISGDKSDEGGYTDWYYFTKDGVQYFQNSNIKVAKYSPLDGKLMSDKQIYSIILHEIGHALGISDHSPFKGDIMYYSTASFLNEKGMISKRDINTIKKIYKEVKN